MKKKVFPVIALILSIFLSGRPFSIYATGDSFDSVNYQLVDYVYPKNNGSGIFINTGYQPNQNTTIISTFSNSGSNTGFYYGVTKTVNGSARSIGLKNGSSNYQIRTMNNNTNVNITGSKFSDNVVFTVNQSPTVTTITSGNTTYTSSTYSYGNYTLASLYIFGLNNNGLTTGNSYARLYYMEIYESSVLVHHYYPCYRKSDNVVGIYDGVSGVFTTSSGGDLAYGSAVLQQYTITTSVSPSGSGSVSGGGSYNVGSVISLTAVASSGYVFDHWSDNDTSNPRSVTVTTNETYTAVFVESSTPVPTYTVTTSVSPNGAGSVSGGGTYNEGTSVVLTASASTGYSFVKWSDDTTSNPKTIILNSNVSITAIFEEESSNPDPEPPSSWTNWTDEDDQEYLQDITSSIDLSKIYWSMGWKREYLAFDIYGYRMNFVSGYSGDYTVSFTGTYYDNTITGITACNSTSYQSSTTVTAPSEQITVNPFVIGELNAGPFGYLQFGVDVTDVTNSQGSVTGSYQSNTTEACRLVGVYNDDSSLGVLQYLDYGYEIKTYNDGNGNTATVFVPGDEEIEFDADMEFFDDLLDGLYANILNNMQIVYRDVFTIQMHGKDGYLLPEYGSVYSDAFIGTLFDWNGAYIGEGNQWPFNYINKHFSQIPTENSYAQFNAYFYRSVNSETNKLNNYTNLYWSDTRNPEWIFETDTVQEFKNQNLTMTLGPYYTGQIYNTYGSSLSSTYGDAKTISASEAATYNLTQGSIMMLSASNVKFYQYKNNSILNRFNQLGSFLSSWFNRIYQSIGNITGGNESNEIINNVINDYDISVETDFNGLLQNVENYREDIDLTLPEFNLPSSDVSGIQSLAGSFKDIYEEVYINNGLGILVFVPLLLLVLRLIL